MNRSKRKNRTSIELGLKSSGGVFDLLDNLIKSTFYINDEEFDFLCEQMTDEEISLFNQEGKTFAERKKLLLMVEKYINLKL